MPVIVAPRRATSAIISPTDPTVSPVRLVGTHASGPWRCRGAAVADDVPRADSACQRDGHAHRAASTGAASVAAAPQDDSPRNGLGLLGSRTGPAKGAGLVLESPNVSSCMSVLSTILTR